MDVTDIDLRSVDHVLTTTRAVRRRLDLGRPVERELIESCIDIATQAPTALHGETWHFVVITEPSQRAAVAEIYRRAAEGHRSGVLPLIRTCRPYGRKSRTTADLPSSSGCSAQVPISSDTCKMSQFSSWRVSKVGSRTRVRAPRRLFTDPSFPQSGL
jgi:nitroreductase